MTSDWRTSRRYHLPDLPQPSARNIAMGIHRAAQRVLRQGHPWLYAQAIERQSHEGQPGDFAVIFDHQRRFLAIGLYDPTSPIRVRILHQGRPTPIDAHWFEARIGAAVARRRALQDDVRTTGYRLIHGESDGLPGLVLDRYGDTCVLKLYTVAWVAHLAHMLPALVEASGARDLILRLSRAVTDHKALLYSLQPGQRLYGPGAHREADEGKVVHFRENGLRFTADVVHGQKTGFFFDHRHNRSRVERLARGCEVLNLFAYTGAFSLYAARGGARRVLSQDLSAPALDAAQAHFDLNRGDALVAAAAHQVLQGDAFEALASLHGAGESFDLIIVDPPSFASSMDDVPNALRAYQRLVRGALRLLRSEGMLVMASCTARVTPQQFYDSVLESAEAMGVRLQETARTGHALDHPVGFTEGRYLKCLFARRADGA